MAKPRNPRANVSGDRHAIYGIRGGQATSGDSGLPWGGEEIVIVLASWRLSPCDRRDGYSDHHILLQEFLPKYSYSKRAGCGGASSLSAGSEKLLKPTPTRRKRFCGPRPTRSRSDSAMLVNSSQVEGGEAGVWLRVRISNSLVFSLRTTVRAMRDSLREADQIFSASSRIIGSVSASVTSCSNVSSADMDFVGLSGTTSPLSRPRANSWRRKP